MNITQEIRAILNKAKLNKDMSDEEALALFTLCSPHAYAEAKLSLQDTLTQEQLIELDLIAKEFRDLQMQNTFETYSTLVTKYYEDNPRGLIEFLQSKVQREKDLLSEITDIINA